MGLLLKNDDSVFIGFTVYWVLTYISRRIDDDGLMNDTNEYKDKPKVTAPHWLTRQQWQIDNSVYMNMSLFEFQIPVCPSSGFWDSNSITHSRRGWVSMTWWIIHVPESPSMCLLLFVWITLEHTHTFNTYYTHISNGYIINIHNICLFSIPHFVVCNIGLLCCRWVILIRFGNIIV